MKVTETNRRTIIIAGASLGLGALVPSLAAQQKGKSIPLPFSARELGNVHESTVNYISENLGDEAPNTRKGLHQAVGLLKQLGFIDGDEAKLLDGLVDELYDSTDLDALREQIEAVLRTAIEKANDLTVAVVSIALSSIRYVIESVKKKLVDHQRAIFVVSGDISGALLGAAGCLKLGYAFAVVGALTGAVVGSYGALYTSRQGDHLPSRP
jgi:hypothetical protein